MVRCIFILLDCHYNYNASVVVVAEKALMHDGGVSQCSNHTQDLEKKHFM